MIITWTKVTLHYVNNIPEMLIPCDEVNILNTFRVMIILRLLVLLTNLHLKLLSTQGTGADKLLSTQRVKQNNIVQQSLPGIKHFEKKKNPFFFFYSRVHPGAAVGCVSAIWVHPRAALQGLRLSA